jgi:hypothetical protein
MGYKVNFLTSEIFVEFRSMILVICRFLRLIFLPNFM